MNLTARGQALMRQFRVVLPNTDLAPFTEATHRAEHGSASDPNANNCNTRPIRDNYYDVIGADFWNQYKDLIVDLYNLVVLHGGVKLIAMKLLDQEHFLADVNGVYGQQRTTYVEFRRAFKVISYMQEHNVTYDDRNNQRALLRQRTLANRRNAVL